MTCEQFLTEYRKQINLRYGEGWSTDITRLDFFMDTCRATLNGEHTQWEHHGPASQAAWRTIGGQGRLTLKALRALPSGGSQ